MINKFAYIIIDRKAILFISFFDFSHNCLELENTVNCVNWFTLFLRWGILFFISRFLCPLQSSFFYTDCFQNEGFSVKALFLTILKIKRFCFKNNRFRQKELCSWTFELANKA